MKIYQIPCQNVSYSWQLKTTLPRNGFCKTSHHLITLFRLLLSTSSNSLNKNAQDFPLKTQFQLYNLHYISLLIWILYLNYKKWALSLQDILCLKFPVGVIDSFAYFYSNKLIFDSQNKSSLKLILLVHYQHLSLRIIPHCQHFYTITSDNSY